MFFEYMSISRAIKVRQNLNTILGIWISCGNICLTLPIGFLRNRWKDIRLYTRNLTRRDNVTNIYNTKVQEKPPVQLFSVNYNVFIMI